MNSPNVHDPHGIRNGGTREFLATSILGLGLMMMLTTWWWYAMR
jgi:hypothetical protein